MKRAGYLLLILPALPASAGGQQPARIHGVVVDSSSGRPIAGADVILGDEDRSTGTGGRFLFGSAAPGVWQLRIRAVGFAPQERQIEVLPGSERRIEVQLAPLAIQLAGVTITGRRDVTLSGAELEQRGSTLATALDGWQGIVVSRTGTGNEAVAQVRGSAPDEVLVLVDGFPANNPFTGRADLARFASRDVEQVSLERGAQAAQSGTRAIAGVIRIETRRTGNSGLAVRVGSFGARDSRAALGSDFGRVSFGAEQLSNGFEYSVPGGGEADRRNAGGTVYSLNARLIKPIEVTARASLSDRGLPGTVTNPTPGGSAQDHAVFLGVSAGRRLQAAASVEWLSTRAWDSTPPPGFISYDATTRGWGISGALALRQPITVFEWRGDVLWRADVRHDGFSGAAVVPGADFTRGGIGIGARLERSAGKTTWSVAPAARLEWWTGRSEPAASVRLDGQWLREGTRVTLGAGSAVTAPVLADILFREGVGIRLNPDLQPERVRWEVEAGIGQDLRLGSIGASLNLRGYWGRVEDMVLWTPDFRFVWSPGNFDVLRRGGEASVELDLPSDIQVSSNTSLSVVTYDTPSGAQVRYRPRFTHSTAVNWAPDAWNFSLRWHHVGVRYPNNAETNPLPAADLVGLSLRRQLGRMFSAQAEVRDLLDQRPTYIAGFPTPGRAYYISFNLELP